MMTMGCAGSKTSGTTAETQKQSEKKKNRSEWKPQSLADYLRRVPGVTVSGTGIYLKVVIRAQGTSVLSNDPLYVIDGVPAGTRYSIVQTLVTVDNIESVRVLNSKAETAIYGAQGANGIIYIKLKNE